MNTLIKFAEQNGYEYKVKITISEQKLIQINIRGNVVEVKDYKKYYSVYTETSDIKRVRLAKQTEVVKYLKEVTEKLEAK